jgi:uncharacterized protein YunC (DUF1805 family)
MADLGLDLPVGELVKEFLEGLACRVDPAVLAEVDEAPLSVIRQEEGYAKAGVFLDPALSDKGLLVNVRVRCEGPKLDDGCGGLVLAEGLDLRNAHDEAGVMAGRKGLRLLDGIGGLVEDAGKVYHVGS